MKCIVRKLKVTINNANLPVYENVVLKNYIMTTQDGQYIPLNDIEFTQNNVKMEATFEATDNPSNSVPVCGVSQTVFLKRKSIYVRAQNTTEGDAVSVAINTECRAGFDSSDCSFFVDETTGYCTKPISGSFRVKLAQVFSSLSREEDSKAGIIKIKQVKITDTPNNIVYTLVPAEVNGVAGLYDADRGTFYTEANGGTLICG